jgi:hypothetical protein
VNFVLLLGLLMIPYRYFANRAYEQQLQQQPATAPEPATQHSHDHDQMNEHH